MTGTSNETIKALELAKRIQALSQTGLCYSTDGFNIERYGELAAISHQLMELFTAQPIEKIKNFYLNGKEYPTPKTDIRAVIFNEENEILLVREKSDNRWSLPGGWADIGYSPKEIAVKEVAEETGYVVIPKRLLAILDKRHHAHPFQPEYVYKLFIECAIVGGEIRAAHDITGVSFFKRDNIPPLSEDRVLPSQVELMFEFLDNPGKAVVFD